MPKMPKATTAAPDYNSPYNASPDNPLFDLGLSFIFSALRVITRNPKKKAELKRVFLKIRNAINDAYADDPDFE